MVGSDVEQNGYISLELVHVVELETAKFDDVVVVLLLGYLKGEAVADVSCQSGIQASLLEYVVNQRCRCCLAVASGNANHLGIGISACKLDFRNDRNVVFLYLYNHRSVVGNSRALYNLVGIKD